MMISLSLLQRTIVGIALLVGLLLLSIATGSLGLARLQGMTRQLAVVEAAKAAGSLSIDMVVLTPDCYSPKHGAGYKNMLQSEFIKSVIPADAKVIIAMPSTSVANNPAFYTVAPSQVSMLITDEALSPEMADQIEKSGVKVELA